MSKHKKLPYKWDLYFDVKDTYGLTQEYRRLKKLEKSAKDRLAFMNILAQEDGLLEYLTE